MNVKDYIASIPGFPKEGIIFHDVTPILQNPDAFAYVTDEFTKFVEEIGADVIVGPEARGFLFATPLALRTHKSFVPIRKPGKLPRETIEQEYGLEYGTDKLCIHTDAIQPGQKVVIIDDLLATGGTTEAIVQLIQRLGGEVAGCGFIIELDDLHGRDNIPYPVFSITHFEGE